MPPDLTWTVASSTVQLFVRRSTERLPRLIASLGGAGGSCFASRGTGGPTSAGFRGFFLRVSSVLRAFGLCPTRPTHAAVRSWSLPPCDWRPKRAPAELSRICG